MSDTEEKEKKVYDHLFKILLAGDARVGKSCIMKQYVDLTFKQDYQRTPGVDFAVKNLQVDRQKVKLHILDIPGEALQDHLEKEKSYYKGVHGVIIVFDVTDQQSFENVKLYHDKAKDWCPKGFKFLMGTKNDLQGQRKVKTEDAISIAKELRVEYFEVSATDNSYLLGPFNAICGHLLKSKDAGTREGAWWKKRQPTV